MRPFARGCAPDELDEATQRRLGQAYAERKQRKRGHELRWPRISGRGLDEIVREALERMTLEHCSYCDGYPLRIHERTPPIDHFRPKGSDYPAFWPLAFTGTNLYVVCGHCNHHKLERWDAALLAPDEPGFRFERYFIVSDPRVGRVSANPAASREDQRRAEVTIEILGLNEGDLPRWRATTLRRWLHHRLLASEGREADPSLDDFEYRLLLEDGGF